jgi:hypothetical protein
LKAGLKFKQSLNPQTAGDDQSGTAAPTHDSSNQGHLLASLTQLLIHSIAKRQNDQHDKMNSWMEKME